MTAQCGWAAFTEEQGPKFLKHIFETPQKSKYRVEDPCDADEYHWNDKSGRVTSKAAKTSPLMDLTEN